MGAMTTRAADLAAQQREHIDAARRLRRAIEAYPDAREGLLRCASWHVREASALAVMMCGADPARKSRPAPAQARRRSAGRP